MQNKVNDNSLFEALEDFRNPLNCINGNIDLALYEVEDNNNLSTTSIQEKRQKITEYLKTTKEGCFQL